MRKSLAAKARDDPDFWSVAGFIELRMYTAIGRSETGGRATQDRRRIRRALYRVSAPSMWSSVIDQASFVLPKYAASAAGAERSAAEALLAKLHSYAVSDVALSNFRRRST